MVGSGWELGHHGGTVRLGHADTDGGKIIKSRKNITLDLSNTHGPFVLALLSTSVGIDNGGGISNAHGEMQSTGVKGITSSAPGAVVLGATDLTQGPWTHMVGAVGELKQVYTQAGAAKVAWAAAGEGASSPMTWLTAPFAAPAAVLAPPGAATELTATLNLDVSGLSRGRFFVNGFDLGRYWSKLCGGVDI